MKKLFTLIACAVLIAICPSLLIGAERITAVYTSIAAAYAPF